MTEIGEHDRNFKLTKLTLNLTENIRRFKAFNLFIYLGAHINVSSCGKFKQGNGRSFGFKKPRPLLLFIGVIFWSSSNIKVHQCKDFSVTIQSKFGHLDSVK